MAYVVAEPCINCKYTECATVCPVDAFREGPNFLVIDPFECIDCDACVPACPAEAIFPEDEVPLDWEHYVDINERLSEQWTDRLVVEMSDPLPNADDWADKEDKEEHLQESWN